MALPDVPPNPAPFTVVEYFTDPSISGFHDPRHHAVSLAYVVPVAGDCVADAGGPRPGLVHPGRGVERRRPRADDRRSRPAAAPRPRPRRRPALISSCTPSSRRRPETRTGTGGGHMARAWRSSSRKKTGRRVLVGRACRRRPATARSAPGSPGTSTGPGCARRRGGCARCRQQRKQRWLVRPYTARPPGDAGHRDAAALAEVRRAASGPRRSRLAGPAARRSRRPGRTGSARTPTAPRCGTRCRHRRTPAGRAGPRRSWSAGRGSEHQLDAPIEVGLDPAEVGAEPAEARGGG